MTKNENLAEQSPIAIDTRIAELDSEIAAQLAKLTSHVHTLLSYAGMRDYGRKTHAYVNTGTYAEAVPQIRRMAEAGRVDMETNRARPADERWQFTPGALNSNQADYAERGIAAVETIKVELARLRELRAPLAAEYARRPWTRFYLVTSSAGHVHNSTRCQTCRWSTSFGWVPGFSGISEAEAIAKLAQYADTLCSVCFPTAPVARKRTNITKAQAIRMSAGTVDTE